MFKSFLIGTLVLISQSSIAESKFIVLKNKLEKLGFQVIIALPPINFSQTKSDYLINSRRAYGLLESSTQKIWINPVVFDLNIATPTLIHESVHAAQVCAGGDKLKTLNLDIQPINDARPFFLRYADIHQQDLEKEAYAVQTQPNSFELALSLLEKHCQ
jgi:hypothetical protein